MERTFRSRTIATDHDLDACDDVQVTDNRDGVIATTPPRASADDEWLELARHVPLAAVLDLDGTLLPLTATPQETLDRGLVLLLEALHHAGIQVIIVSGRASSVAEQLQSQMPQAWWIPKPAAGRAGMPMREIVGWVRDRIPGVRLIAIGDDELDEELFETLDTALQNPDRAVAVRSRGSRPTRASLTLAGPTAVRAMLWWLIEARTGSRADVRPPPIEASNQAGETALARTELLLISDRTLCERNRQGHEVGGLASVLEPALRDLGGLWLGWSGGEGALAPAPRIDHAQLVQATFDLSGILRERFHDGFCDGTLWPLLHGFSERVQYLDEDWRAYVAANELYAKYAVRLATPGSTIWVHDYPLLLVADALRAYGHRGPIGLFIHVPFPPRDQLETLPWYGDVLDRMRAFDLIGFQTEQWADNFASCLDARDRQQQTHARRPQLGVFPVGIDPISPVTVVDPDIASMQASLGTRRLILAVDPLDRAKGIPERLAAFEYLLEQYPEWRRKVTLVQIAAPTRVTSVGYDELRKQVEFLVGRINGMYGEADWVPVRYLYRAYGPSMLAQLYRRAEVALVTPLRDGLNLIAKEFVAAQDLEEPGVLVLSRFAGAAVELGDAILTNPHHAAGLAADIDRALRMPLDERRRRASRLAATVASTSPARWATAFLDRLAASRHPSA